MRSVHAAVAALFAAGLSACDRPGPEIPATPVPHEPLAPPSDGAPPVAPDDGSTPDTPTLPQAPPINPPVPDTSSPAVSGGPPAA